jgi:hypothetical protein
LRLESQEEFVAQHGFGQRPLGLDFFLVLGSELLVEQAVPSAARRFCMIHGDVGGPH